MNWYGNEFLAFFWILTAAFLLAFLTARALLPQPDAANFLAPELDSYILARLNSEPEKTDGIYLPIDVALCSLRWQCVVEKNEKGLIAIVPGIAPPTHPFELAVLDKIGTGKDIWAIHAGLRKSLMEFDGTLVEAGLIFRREIRKRFRVLIYTSVVTLLLIGGGKIWIGLQREKPVFFLVVSCVLVYILGWRLETKIPYRTRRGARYLDQLRASTPKPKAYNPRVTTLTGLVTGAALWGHEGL
ncbi:TIGR04222 domain-containing membrane protein [bacterium]|nr:MAG: TIGR04222 domain-containing membrane protein [bacterium]